jgi:hypothetical protein
LFEIYIPLMRLILGREYRGLFAGDINTSSFNINSLRIAPTRLNLPWLTKRFGHLVSDNP